MFTVTPSTRLHASPFYESTVADGVKSFTVYNHMLMPTSYGDPEGEYWRLIEGVSMWDVAVERQVEFSGKDAAELAQMLVPRDLSRQPVGLGYYVPVCDHDGTLLNDPILLKVEEDRYWLSIADSDLLFWVRAIAAERKLDVEICVPDVSPMAVQGPKAEDTVAALMGDWVREIKHFRFAPAELDGIPLVVARSGWSKQGGFELYLMDGSRGHDLWNRVKEAGRPFDIGPGNPNACERIESGLLSWGGDTDDTTNPFEVRMGRYVHLDVSDEVIGVTALREIAGEGTRRQQLGVILQSDEPAPGIMRWCDVKRGDEVVGSLTNLVWSYRLKKNIGFVLVDRSVAPGEEVVVMVNGAPMDGDVVELPFI